MLDGAEKAYCLALIELRRHNYEAAAELFGDAGDYLEDNDEFVLLRETTRLLLAVRAELAELEVSDKLEIKEEFSRG